MPGYNIGLIWPLSPIIVALSLKQSQAVADIADVLYDFLPGSGNAVWKGHVSFSTVAEKCGVGDFWQPGSKLPALTALLQRTLEHRRGSFERLVLEIVRAGLVYRNKKKRPILPAEIKKLNGHLVDVGFKFPDLWDREFVESLGMDSAQRAQRRVDEVIARDQQKQAEESARLRALNQLKQEFFALHDMESAQEAGYAFESILNRLFALEGLDPREPFRVTGEQIDGSFDLDYETYLLEAKWEKSPISEGPLLVFRGKIEGKSAMTRGVFISLNGISAQAREAIVHGKQATFFIVDGYDLSMILADQIALTEFLRQRRRLLAEEGELVVQFQRLKLRPRSA
jgi:hypothetical protein